MRAVLTLIGLALLGLLATTIVLMLLWHLMGSVSPDGARLWALVATLAAPAIGYGGFRLGVTYAKGAVEGLKMGVAQVHTAAERSIGLKVKSIQKTREAMQEQQAPLNLPAPDFDMIPVTTGRQIDL